jgi:predicted  nucleic acid-binding Zn-ribbon protein
MWDCPKCGTLNILGLPNCPTCRAPRPEEPAPEAPATPELEPESGTQDEGTSAGVTPESQVQTDDSKKKGGGGDAPSK